VAFINDVHDAVEFSGHITWCAWNIFTDGEDVFDVRSIRGQHAVFEREVTVCGCFEGFVPATAGLFGFETFASVQEVSFAHLFGDFFESVCHTINEVDDVFGFDRVL